MKKTPQWIFKHNVGIQHPYAVLKDVATVLDMEAGFYRKERNTEAARALKRAAAALREVMAGKTFGEAFEFNPPSAALGESIEEK